MEEGTQSVQSSDEAAPLVFGIYPGNSTGNDQDRHTDNPARIAEALKQLQPRNVPFMVRSYTLYVGSSKLASETPLDAEQYANGNTLLDLALCYRTPDGDLDDWVEVVRRVIRRYGTSLAKIQITEEPNNPNPAAGGDGSSPRVLEAISVGVLAAKDEARRLGYNVQVGFNATPSFDNSFWEQLAPFCSQSFIDALDYVGFDFFPDVFRPLPLGPNGSPISLRDAVTLVLTGLRTTNLPTVNILSSVPIHINENGWPTSPIRSYEQQATVLETVVRTIHELRAKLNITHYEYFGLRDLDSSSSDLQFGLLRFGLLHDDYTPKPAFSCYQRLIAELGAYNCV